MSKLNTSSSRKPLVALNDSGLSFRTDDEVISAETSFLDNEKPNGDEKVEINIYIGEDDVTVEDNSNDSCDSSDSGNGSFISNFANIHAKVEHFVGKNKNTLKMVVLTFLAFCYFGYFLAALVLGATRDCVNTVPLIVLTSVGLAMIVINYVWTHFGASICKNCIKPCHVSITNNWNIFKWLGGLVIYGGVVAITAVTVWESPKNLVSVAGLVTFIGIMFVCSANPMKVNWRPVIGGLTIQFYFAVLILKWDIGFKFFQFLGKEVQGFLSYTDYGSKFVFGDKYLDHIFAMKVLPVIVFFSCFISTLYYLGVMQAIIGKIAWVMQMTLGTTAPESLCAAGNIFVGQTEAPILIRPFLPQMTKSELHAVMVGGFATIAGGVLAAYVSFGVPAEHLLCASVMNAPGALAFSKLLYPETEKSKIKKVKHVKEEEIKHRNLLEAAAAGASASIVLVANIAANLIAFLALLAFVNGALSWFGGFVCFPELSFERICSYLFMPIAYLMGVEWEDAGVVGELVGIKTFLNEFVAYKELSVYIKRRIGCIDEKTLSIRSETIATYALCGFSNLSSIGIQLGGLGPMAPKRTGDLAQIVIRALIGGIVTCLTTACFAGLLVVSPTDIMACTSGNLTESRNATAVVNATQVILSATLGYS